MNKKEIFELIKNSNLSEHTKNNLIEILEEEISISLKKDGKNIEIGVITDLNDIYEHQNENDTLLYGLQDNSIVSLTIEYTCDKNIFNQMLDYLRDGTIVDIVLETDSVIETTAFFKVIDKNKYNLGNIVFRVMSELIVKSKEKQNG